MSYAPRQPQPSPPGYFLFVCLHNYYHLPNLDLRGKIAFLKPAKPCGLWIPSEPISSLDLARQTPLGHLDTLPETLILS